MSDTITKYNELEEETNWNKIQTETDKYLDEVDRKSQPVFSGVLAYFPDAIKYVSQVSKAGNDQHHKDKPLHWDRNKSTDDIDALSRHLIDHSVNPIDDDGILHLGKVCWRALATLQKYLENN
jgi:hypothetical protein